MKKFLLVSLSVFLICTAVSGCTTPVKEKKITTKGDRPEQLVSTKKSETTNTIDIAPIKFNSNIFFPVYEMDIQSLNNKISFYIEMADDLSVKEKLDTIAEKLSRYRFNGLPLNLLKIEIKNDKKIAVINLEEFEKNKDLSEIKYNIQSSKVCPEETWRFRYFSGSYAEMGSIHTLVETFLQRGYRGDWIDGVDFLYHEKPVFISTHFGGLNKTIYR